jgi:hypothetical protein
MNILSHFRGIRPIETKNWTVMLPMTTRAADAEGFATQE